MNVALHRVGPSSASATRGLRTRIGPARIVAIVEVWGIKDPGARAALEHRLSAVICDGFGTGKGSTTARIRQGLDAADGLIRRMRDEVEVEGAGGPALGAGASVIVHEGESLTLAQSGPSAAYGPDTDGRPMRIPAESPWLRRGERTIRAELEWPALGTAPDGAAGVHWTGFSASPGTMLIATTTAGAEHLDRAVIDALFATPAPRAGHALEVAVPDDVPAIVLAFPRAEASARPHGGSAGTAIGRSAGTSLGSDSDASHGTSTGDSVGTSLDLPPGRTLERPLSASASAAERLADSAQAARELGTAIKVRSRPARSAAGQAAGRAGHAAARVLVGLLPSRTAEGVRAEWTRLMAAIALGLPLVVLLFSALIASRSAADRPSGADTSAGAPGSPAMPPNTASDAARGIRRLDGADLVPVALTGSPGDPREIVAAGGRRYVLNRELSIIEWIDDAQEAPIRVLERGSVVGGEVVGVIEDLFFLAGAATAEDQAGAAGRAAALDGAGRIWAIDGDAITAVPLGSEPRWRAVSRAASFDGALYALDRAGDIFRYDIGGGAAAPPGAAWLTSDEALDGAIDIAVDGSIWVLFSDGRLNAYVGGETSITGPLAMPVGLRDVRSMYAGSEGGWLLVADAGSGGVFAFDAGGRYVEELRLPAQAAAEPGSDAADGRFSNLHAAWWEREASTLWIVAGDVLFRAPFDG